VSNALEEHRPGEVPEACVRRLAQEKASSVAQRANGDSPILAADTEVVLDIKSGTPLGKPRDAADAARMLHMLSGRSHYVITGVYLMWKRDGGWQSHEAAEITTVFMQPISKQDIDAYVATAEPMDKAGAYAIQGVASRWISRIEGCYFNVVGLPVPLVYRMLREHAPEALGAR